MTIVTITLNPCIDTSFAVARVVPERKLSGHALRSDPGGGGINVARVVSRLGGEVRALWSCGGCNGERLGYMLDAESVTHQGIDIAGDVRESLAISDESTGQQYRFGLPGPRLSQAERADWLAKLRALESGARPNYVVFSGSAPPGVSGDDYAELIRATPRGTRVIVDTKGQLLARAIEVGVYLIKPNAAELAEISGGEFEHDEGIEAAAREIVESGGAEVVLVSLGRGGALLVTASIVLRFSAPSVPLASKVGAGDSLVGGLVTALDRGDSLSDAVAHAVAAGSAAVMTPGTQLCRAEDVARLYPLVGRSGDRTMQ